METAEKFHPISLCDVIYKMISKVIANRFKLIMPRINSQEQWGYIEGRQILDGINIVHEDICSLCNRKKPGLLMKSVLEAMPLYLFSALAASAKIIKAMRAIQRAFLLEGLKKEKKWSLVAWEKVCLTKASGGLGIKDQIMSKAMAGKIWWRWVKSKDDLLGRLWRTKYAHSIEEKDLVRMKETHKGSLIWNNEWQNRGLVQNNCFWEIRQDKANLGRLLATKNQNLSFMNP